MKNEQYINEKGIKQFRKTLLSWFRVNKRSLPFRGTGDPYRIWLSEIMAQQTTMPVVVGYYKRFVKRFPSVEAVAKAREEELLQLWQGLGYYARIRNFHKACHQVMNEYGGKIPDTFEGLKRLKGIGDYTAAAIASICFKEQRAVLDGNVKRVLARLYYIKDIRSKKAAEDLKKKAETLLDSKNPGVFNEAMMELGALVCQKKPDCFHCPVKNFCQAKNNNPERVPAKKAMNYKEVEYYSLLVTRGQKCLLKKPGKDSLIHNMWELPTNYFGNERQAKKQWRKEFADLLKSLKLKKMGTVKHAITNKKIVTHVYQAFPQELVLTKGGVSGFKVMSEKERDKVSVNTLSQKIIKQFG